jgi:hypothetical protein
VGSGEVVIGLSPRGQPLDPCCPLAKEGGEVGGRIRCIGAVIPFLDEATQHLGGTVDGALRE